VARVIAAPAQPEKGDAALAHEELRLVLGLGLDDCDPQRRQRGAVEREAPLWVADAETEMELQRA
jgi:hypothetical protein